MEGAARGASARLREAEASCGEAGRKAGSESAEATKAAAAAAEARLRASAASAMQCGCIERLVAGDAAAKQAARDVETLLGQTSAHKGGAQRKRPAAPPPPTPQHSHMKQERNSRPPSAASSNSRPPSAASASSASSSSTTAASSSTAAAASAAGSLSSVEAEVKAGSSRGGRTRGRMQAEAVDRERDREREEKARAVATALLQPLLDAEARKRETYSLIEEEEEPQPQQQLTPVDELAQLLELLYEKDLKPPQVPVQNAAQLEALLREDPAWFLQVSRGMSVARREGGKMDEDRLMSLFADPAEGQRVAQVLRRRNARKHWSLGRVEDVLGRKGDVFGELHRLMQAEACRRKTEKVRMTGAKRTPASWWTVEEWEHKGFSHREKVLHWPVQSEEAVHELVVYPDWLQRNNWVRGFDDNRRDKTFDVMLQLVHSHDETGAHFDNNACDTWMKLLAGKVLVATWSLDDAREYGAADFCHPQRHTEYDPAKAMDWRKLRSMPSGRLFWLLPGDVLVLPAGTRRHAWLPCTGPTPHRVAAAAAWGCRLAACACMQAPSTTCTRCARSSWSRGTSATPRAGAPASALRRSGWRSRVRGRRTRTR